VISTLTTVGLAVGAAFQGRLTPFGGGAAIVVERAARELECKSILAHINAAGFIVISPNVRASIVSVISLRKHRFIRAGSIKPSNHWSERRIRSQFLSGCESCRTKFLTKERCRYPNWCCAPAPVKHFQVWQVVPLSSEQRISCDMRQFLFERSDGSHARLQLRMGQATRRAISLLRATLRFSVDWIQSDKLLFVESTDDVV
jgi:hypothetical protein